jgi:hypothetical protein
MLRRVTRKRSKARYRANIFAPFESTAPLDEHPGRSPLIVTKSETAFGVAEHRARPLPEVCVDVLVAVPRVPT